MSSSVSLRTATKAFVISRDKVAVSRNEFKIWGRRSYFCVDGDRVVYGNGLSYSPS